MEDIRLKEIPFEFKGKTYELRCNFNVLADIVNYFGKVPDIINGKTDLNLYTAITAFAMNEYADVMGWNQRFTPKEIGRTIDVESLNDPEGRKKIFEVLQLFVDALYTKKESGDDETQETKN